MSQILGQAEVVFKCISDRRSVRDFAPDPVPEEHLKMILEAGRLAPSGENSQPWRFVVIKDQVIKDEIARIAGAGSARRFSGEFAIGVMEQRFAALQDETKRKKAFEKLTSGNVSSFVAKAPVVIAVCGRKNNWDLLCDTAACIENMLLMATALGLGACWVIAPVTDCRDDAVASRLLGVPPGFKLISVIPVGVPARVPNPRPRIPLEEITFRDSFGNPYFSGFPGEGRQ